MTDIRQQVQERIEAEAQNAEPPKEKEELSSKFIRECLRANEVGDGILYNTLHRGRFVYVKSMDLWLTWTGHHWEHDEMDEAKAAVENVVAVYLEEARRVGKQIAELQGDPDAGPKIKRLENLRDDLFKRASGLRSMRRRNNCLNAAHTCADPLAIHGREIDQNPWLLPCANGVIDLKTGEIRDGHPEDYMLRASPVEYHGINAERKTWEKTLQEIFENNESLISFMRRLLGMAAVGGVYEHVFILMVGPGGRNGKSTIIDAISSVMGPLAGPIIPEMLLDTYQVQSANAPSPDIMDLRGLRYAFASETKDGAKISCNKVKWFSGGTELKGRNPHDKYPTAFKPTHTIIVDTNFEPSADGSDKAFWERVIKIPFNVRFLKNREPEAPNERKADLFLKEKLKAEESGILGWLIQGCLEWQLEGLNPPPIVRLATNQYQDDEDTYGGFVETCLERAEGVTTGATDLHDAFQIWWKKNIHNYPPKNKTFGKKMREFFKAEKIGGVVKYFDVRLNDEWFEILEEERSRKDRS